jgi:hypothetical protein
MPGSIADFQRLAAVGQDMGSLAPLNGGQRKRRDL